MVFYRQTVKNNNITTKHILKYAKKYTRYVPIKMMTGTKSIYSNIDGY